MGQLRVGRNVAASAKRADFGLRSLVLAATMRYGRPVSPVDKAGKDHLVQWRFIIGLLLGGALASGGLGEEPPKLLETPLPDQRVKAAFLYNFLKLTEWPDAAFAGRDSPIVIGVVGPDRFGSALGKTIESRRVNGRRIEVRQFSEFTRASVCQLLFVATVEPAEWARLLALADGRPILTVGESAGFARQGGMIGLFRDKEMVRLAVNREAVGRAGLRLSSRLLQLATIVGPATAAPPHPERR